MQSDSLGFTLSRALRSWRQRINVELEPKGITYSTWFTLVYLDQGGAGMLQRELAQYMGIEAPTLVRRLDQLEQEGFVERRASTHDRRANSVHLTTRGRDLLEAVNLTAANIRENMLSGVSDAEMATCQQVLQTIIDNAAEMANRADAGGG